MILFRSLNIYVGEVESLQGEKIDREEANTGELAGVKTNIGKDILRKRIRVYKVNI